MKGYPGSHIIFSISIFLMFFVSQNATAIPFGAFDPRSLAMGGAGVASGNSTNAAFFNPALMATYQTRKEIGKNSRIIIPTITARVAQAMDIIDNADEDQYEQDLVDAINTFNANLQNNGSANSQDARAVLAATRTLDDAVEDISDGPVHFDANIGVLLSIGHKYEGGAFIFNRRYVGDGVVENFDGDIALLEEYIAAMEFIEGGGQPVQGAALFPNVFDAGGNVIDQTGNLNSVATGSALQMTELGMAISKEFALFDRKISFGITPKMMQVITYDFTADATSGDSTSVEDENDDWDINLDVGMAHNVNQQWRLGMVVKNVRTLKYKTSLGNKIELKPQVRAGAQFASAWGLYALDVDVVENEPVSRGSKSQVYSLGGEWNLQRSFQVRAGFTRNIKGEGNNGDGLFSAGLHWDFGGVLDFTYAENNVEQAFGLQIGARF